MGLPQIRVEIVIIRTLMSMLIIDWEKLEKQKGERKEAFFLCEIHRG